MPARHLSAFRRYLLASALALLCCCCWAAADDPPQPFEWVKGTTWNWNSWREVTFECDGRFVTTQLSTGLSVFF
jgi:hypothetical protein